MRAKAGIYQPLGSDGYELCYPRNQGDFEKLNVELNGVPRESGWTPIPMRLVRSNEGEALAKSDSPWLGSHALILRKIVVDLMGPLLLEYGELLPLECPEADVWIFNATRLVDALDEDASSMMRLSNGKIILIQQHAFKANVVRDVDIFKIPNLRVSPTFLSQRFVDRWNDSGLQGLEFNEVWTAPHELS